MSSTALSSIKPAAGRIVFVDTEFTNLSFEEREVWEIAGIVRDPGEPDREYEWQIRPNLRDADSNSLRIGGYYRRCMLVNSHVGSAMVVAHPDLTKEVLEGNDYNELSDLLETHASAVAGEVARMIDGAHLVGAVPNADELALHGFLRQYGQARTNHYHLIDVEGMAVGFINGLLRASDTVIDGMGLSRETLCGMVDKLPWKSDDLCRAVGVTPPKPEDRHRALVDARWARDLYDAITDGRMIAAR